MYEEEIKKVFEEAEDEEELAILDIVQGNTDRGLYRYTVANKRRIECLSDIIIKLNNKIDILAGNR